MDNLEILITVVGAIAGGFCGWALRAQHAVPERLRLVAHFEGRTRLAEKDLEAAQRELTGARLEMRRIEQQQGESASLVPTLKHQVELLTKELAEVRRELLEREQLLERIEADDLSRLPGVGPVLEGRLKQVGIERYEDLASMDEGAIARLAEKLNIPLRTIKRHDWPREAASLVQERGLAIG